MKNRQKSFTDITVSPVVQAHTSALLADEALRRRDFVTASKQNRIASENFMLASKKIRDSATIYALKILAESHARRALELGSAKGVGTGASVDASDSESTTPNHETSSLEQRQGPSADTTLSNRQLFPEPDSPSSAIEMKPDEKINELEQAEAELNELWQRLNELGISRGHYSAHDKVSASRHLSSALGDSFCFVPTKGRSIKAAVSSYDRTATLQAAVASRLRTQRERFLQQSIPQKIPNYLMNYEQQTQTKDEEDDQRRAKKEKSHGEPTGAVRSQDLSYDQETQQHQQHEMMRLLRAVKTLSTENSKLLKECDDKALLAQENTKLKVAMKLFKDQYHLRVRTMQRALEEWRRQKDQYEYEASSSKKKASSNSDNANLEAQVERLEEQLKKEKESSQKKDILLQKYHNWYQTLRASTQAKSQPKHARS